MKKILITIAAVLALAVSAQAVTPEQATAAKQILAKNGNAVIEVNTILKIELPGQPSRDQKLEILGTVIDESGLTIVSNSAIDPLSMMKGQFPDGMEPKIKYSDVKFKMSDNKEIPARVVLKDADLDLAFLVPTPKEGETVPKFQAVALDAKVEAAILDNVFNLTRLPKSLDRQVSVELGYISAVIQKPRRFYSYETIGGGQVGIPSFTADGKALGLCLLRKEPASEASGSRPQMSTVVVPSSDILELVPQAQAKAKEAPAPEPKEEAKPEAKADDAAAKDAAKEAAPAGDVKVEVK
ncbi:MAG TPA: S1C family serine protease [Candidatus Sumerlaeota bacterium]|nr:S1C family serine protease [Candidatus Sumerlaeota bacterium]HPS00171.1 S1C family serine protease [Candidatus Sumerlaeota bacterium]